MSRSTSTAPRGRLSRSAVAAVAFFGLLFGGVAALPAHAAESVPAGEYGGSSDAYTGATVTFDIDAAGVMSGFASESYCFDGFGVYPIQWFDMPPTQIQAGVPFDLRWEPTGVSVYFELKGVVNADGTASGTGRAGFLPSGTCGGMEFDWSASLDGDGGENPDPDGPPAVTVEPGSLRHVELEVIGAAISATGFPEDADAAITITRDRDERLLREFDARSDADGEVFFYYRDDLPSSHTGESYTVAVTTVVDGETTTASSKLVVINDSNAFIRVTQHDLTSTPASVTPDDLAAGGITFTSNYPANVLADLYIDGRVVGQYQSPASGGIEVVFTSDTLGLGEHEAMLLATVPEGHNNTPHRHAAIGTFTVTEEPVVIYDPVASVTPESLTVSALAAPGVTISGSGFPADAPLTVWVAGSQVGETAADADGNVAYGFTSDALGAGTHAVALASGDLLAETSFTVTSDPIVYDPSASVTPGSVTVSGLADSGVTISGAGFPADAGVTVSVAGAEVGATSADAAGAVAFPFVSSTLGAGTHAVVLTSGDLVAESSFVVTEDPIVYDPSASVTPGSVTVSGLADSGVSVSGSGFPSAADVTLTVAGVEIATSTADSFGAISFPFTSSTLGAGTHAVVLTSGDLVAESSFVVTEDPIVYDPSASVTPGSVTVSGLAGSGVTVTGAGFPADAAVTVSVAGAEVGTTAADAAGAVTFPFTSSALGAGTHTVVLTSGDLVAESSFVVTEDPIVYDPSASVTPGSVTVSVLAGSGVTIVGAGFPADAAVTVSVAGAEVGTVTADAAGVVSFPFTSSALGAGTHAVVLTSGDLVAESSFVVTEDPIVYDPSASVTPGSVTVSGLAGSGVTIAGAGFPADAAVTVSVAGAEVGTVTADAAGVVSFPFTSSSLGAGAQEVVLTSGDLVAESSFVVTEDPVFYDPKAAVTPDSVTVSGLAGSGVTVSGSGFPSDADVVLTVAGVEVATSTADSFGAISFPFSSSTLGAGTHEVVLTSADHVAESSFTVTDDPIVYDPSASVAPGTVTVSELAGSGVTITGAGFPADTEVTISVAGAEFGTTIADAAGAVSVPFLSSALAPGAYAVVLTAGDLVAESSFTVTADPTTIPGITPIVDELDPALEGGISAPPSAKPGDVIAVHVPGATAGDSVGAWVFSTPQYLGTRTVTAGSLISVTIPADLTPGVHTLAVWDASGAQLGWTAITITAPTVVDPGEPVPADPGAPTAPTAPAEIAVTGAEGSALPLGVAALVLLMGGMLLLIARRRTASE